MKKTLNKHSSKHLSKSLSRHSTSKTIQPKRIKIAKGAKNTNNNINNNRNPKNHRIKHSAKSTNTNQASTSKTTLHPRNQHQGRYDLEALCLSLPELKQHIISNPIGELTIDFSNPTAVKQLNKALLIHHYDIEYWDIPDGYLCPPIPSRADYLHHMADLLTSTQLGVQCSDEPNEKTHVLDIGTGANCIYPIIGAHSYDWQFTATDIDPIAVANAKHICQKNKRLSSQVSIKQQFNTEYMFKHVITKEDTFAFTMCNPPFHASLQEAMAGNRRKRRNLARHQSKKNPQKSNHNPRQTALNFGGQKAELWCQGGEIGFLKRMAIESKEFATQVGWFSSLVSKAENVHPTKKLLNKLGATQITIIPMQHGQKTTRIIAWTWMY